MVLFVCAINEESAGVIVVVEEDAEEITCANVRCWSVDFMVMIVGKISRDRGQW